MSQQHKPYTDRSSCSKTCFHVSIIECPFTLNPWQSLTFFGLFETSSWREERDGRYFHTLYKQRVRKPRTRTSACIENLLTCKILTMVMPNVRLFVFCVFAPFSRRKFIHRLRPVFFHLCYGPLHKSSPGIVRLHRALGAGWGRRGRGNWVEVRHQGQDRLPHEAVCR